MTASSRITDAVDGIPTVAQCDACGAEWRRPDWDPRADTLVVWARGHACVGVEA